MSCSDELRASHITESHCPVIQAFLDTQPIYKANIQGFRVAFVPPCPELTKLVHYFCEPTKAELGQRKRFESVPSRAHSVSPEHHWKK